MESDIRGVTFLRYFIVHQRERDAYVLTLVPNLHHTAQAVAVERSSAAARAWFHAQAERSVKTRPRDGEQFQPGSRPNPADVVGGGNGFGTGVPG